MSLRAFFIAFIYVFSVVEIAVASVYLFACLFCSVSPHMPLEGAVVFLMGGVARLMLVWIFQTDHSHVCESASRLRAVNDRMAEGVFGEEADKARVKIQVAAEAARDILRKETELTVKQLHDFKPLQS